MRVFASVGAIVAVTWVLAALADAQESGDGPPFSFPGCTEQPDGTFDCGYQGPEEDPPRNCGRPDEGGQLTCYPGGIYPGHGVAGETGPLDVSDPELPTTEEDRAAGGTVSSSASVRGTNGALSSRSVPLARTGFGAWLLVLAGGTAVLTGLGFVFSNPRRPGD